MKQSAFMGINLGLDIGAISLKLAALGGAGDLPRLRTLASAQPQFRLSTLGDRPLLLSDYRRIAGSPVQSAYDLLHDVYAAIPEECVEGLRVTGSGSRAIAKVLGLFFENEFKAIVRAVAALYPQVRTVFEIGGESSKYIRLSEAGIVDYDRSGECAAGTGSFLDQQALRLQYSVEEVGTVVASAGCAARIAGRCSVFAKSDMIHAQQKGYSPAEILRGLCDAVARNYKSSIVKGRPVVAPVALIGAVSQNGGVTAALREAFGLAVADLLVPSEYAWCGAIGAAMLEAEDPRKRSILEIHRLRQHESVPVPEDSRPLSMENVVRLAPRPSVVAGSALADLRGSETTATKPGSESTATNGGHEGEVVDSWPHSGAGAGAAPRIPVYLGLDIGSVSTNVALLDEAGAVVHDVYLRTAGRPIEAVQQGLAEVERVWGRRVEILGVGTTGSGRELIAEFVGADVVNDEITAHKTGAIHVSNTLGGDPVDTIFEIGGQDSKFISIENGVVVDFAMNEACAAGTGSFLEEQAEKLGVAIKGEFAALALGASSPTRLGERCTVFMERDVNGWLHKGETIPNLVAGLAYSIALNYLNRVVRGRKIGKTIYFQGGTAYNDAVTAAFAHLLGKRITVPPYNGVMGAVGMALIARQWRKATGAATRFRGYDLDKLTLTSRDFVCKACSNYCDMKEFVIEGQRSYWGDKCSDKFRKPSATGRKTVIEDLFAYREQLLEELAAEVAPAAGKLRIGLPRAMSMIERLPFWRRYFAELGMGTVLSPVTDPRISAAGIDLAVAQPCYPVQVAHGHVKALIEAGVDYILVPNMADAEAAGGCASHYCPWNQTLPWVLRAAPGLEAHSHRFLVPTLHFQLGPEQVKKALAETMRRLGVSRKASDRAVEAAYREHREFQARLREAGRRALAVLEQTGEPGLILAGRPYNIYDRGVNCDIPRKLRHRYGANVIPLDFLVTGAEAEGGAESNMYWSSGRKILEAARVAGSRANLHLIYITNFKCGPDSYIKHFAREAAGGPLLVLQFDGHGNDAGYMTRAEAYLDSKGILRCYQPTATIH